MNEALNQAAPSIHGEAGGDTAIGKTPSPVEGSRCAIHLDRSAVGTCERCGAFACAECQDASERQQCAACVSRELAALPPLARRASLAQRWLLLMAAFVLFSPAFFDPKSSSVLAVIGLLVQVLQLGLIVAFLRWLHLAVRYARVLGRPVRPSPRAAVLWWFVPVANFIIPFVHVRSLAPEVPTRAWQACWSTALLLPIVLSQASGAKQVLTVLAYGGILLQCVAAVLAARVVKDITASLAPTDA